jgi:hypothetical protein
MNIYITKQNEERLRKESSMSGLVNRLLSEHYKIQDFKGITYKGQQVVKPNKSVADSSEKLMAEPWPIPEPELGETWVQEPGPALKGFCKHNAKIGLCKMGCK